MTDLNQGAVDAMAPGDYSSGMQDETLGFYAFADVKFARRRPHSRVHNEVVRFYEQLDRLRQAGLLEEFVAEATSWVADTEKAG